MFQKLRLPIDAAQLNAGYKSAKYAADWGRQHYGFDLTEKKGKRQLNGMGIGTVIAAGLDGADITKRLGNVLVIVYEDVICHDGKVRDLSCRMYHLESVNVKPGDIVDADTIIGSYGATGNPRNVTGPHLHIEFDIDTNWPTLAPGVTVGAGKIINTKTAVAAAGGIADSTISPALVFWPSDGQTLTGRSDWLAAGWFSAEEINLTPADTESAKYEALAAKYAALQQEYTALQKKYDLLVEGVWDLYNKYRED